MTLTLTSPAYQGSNSSLGLIRNPPKIDPISKAAELLRILYLEVTNSPACHFLQMQRMIWRVS
jgi:hypothetical protein